MYLVFDPVNIKYLLNQPQFDLNPGEAILLITPDQAYLWLSSLLPTPQIDKLTVFPLTARWLSRLKKIINQGSISRLTIESRQLKHLTYLKLKKTLSCRLVLKKDLIASLRQIKSSTEIKAIKQACRLVDQALVYIKPKLKPGKTETQLAWQLESWLRRHGSGALPFPPVVASGPNSAIPHHSSGSRRLQNQEIVLIDIGARINGYCSDLTRVFFLGRPSLKQKQIYRHVLTAQKLALRHLQGDSKGLLGGGTKSSEVDKVVRNYFKTHRLLKFFPHSTGHNLGLDIHELPRLKPREKTRLKANMVFTVEPGLYLPHQFGIRIEDTVLKTKTGYRLLTKFPKSLKSVTIS